MWFNAEVCGGWLFVQWEVAVIVGHLGIGVGLYELRKKNFWECTIKVVCRMCRYVLVGVVF